MEKMVKLIGQDATIIDLPARCVGQNINLARAYLIDLGEVPTIISACDSDLVGNGISQTTCLEKKVCNTNRRDNIARFSGMNYDIKLQNTSWFCYIHVRMLSKTRMTT